MVVIESSHPSAGDSSGGPDATPPMANGPARCMLSTSSVLALADLPHWPVPCPWASEESKDGRVYWLQVVGGQTIRSHAHPLEPAFRHALDLLRRAEESSDVLDAPNASREIERELTSMGSACTDFRLRDALRMAGGESLESRESHAEAAHAWMMATFQMLQQVWRRLQAPSFWQDEVGADELAPVVRVRLRGLVRDANLNGQIVSFFASRPEQEEGIARVQIDNGKEFAVRLENIEPLSTVAKGRPFPLSDREQEVLAARCASQWVSGTGEAQVAAVGCDGEVGAAALQATGSSTGQSSLHLGNLDLEAVADALSFLCTEGESAMGDEDVHWDAIQPDAEANEQITAHQPNGKDEARENGSETALVPERVACGNQQGTEAVPTREESCRPLSPSQLERRVESLLTARLQQTESLQGQLATELEIQRLQASRLAAERVASIAQSVQALRGRRDELARELARKRSSNADAELKLERAVLNIAQVKKLQHGS